MYLGALLEPELAALNLGVDARLGALQVDALAHALLLRLRMGRFGSRPCSHWACSTRPALRRAHTCESVHSWTSLSRRRTSSSTLKLRSSRSGRTQQHSRHWCQPFFVQTSRCFMRSSLWLRWP